MNELKLNLGCGSTDYREGWVNIDRSKDVKTDECFDIAKEGLKQWKDNSVDEIHSGCMLEQLTSEQLLFVLNECHRVLKPGCKLGGYVPSTDPRVLHLDPMDKLFFQIDTFRYFIGNDIHWQRFGKNYGFSPWSSFSGNTNPAGIIFFEMTR